MIHNVFGFTAQTPNSDGSIRRPNLFLTLNFSIFLLSIYFSKCLLQTLLKVDAKFSKMLQNTILKNYQLFLIEFFKSQKK